MQGSRIQHELMLCFPEGVQRIGCSPYPVAEASLTQALQPDAFKLLYLEVERQMEAVLVMFG